MRDAVTRIFPTFSADLEGHCLWMYLDAREPRGLVTTGKGNLLSLDLARRLPWRMPDGSRASFAAIDAEWRAVDAMQSRKSAGGGAFARWTTLRLTPADVEVLVAETMRQIERVLRSDLPGWDEWPGDAQLALLSWAWGVGARARYPRMLAALRDWDFRAAAEENDRSAAPGTPLGTLPERNERNRMLLRNAACVIDLGLDRAPVYWPRDLVHEHETVRVLPDAAPTGPVLEDDGGASRRAATSEAVIEGAYRRDEEPPPAA